jgi:hypothetical protein
MSCNRATSVTTCSAIPDLTKTAFQTPPTQVTDTPKPGFP